MSYKTDTVSTFLSWVSGSRDQGLPDSNQDNVNVCTPDEAQKRIDNLLDRARASVKEAEEQSS